MKHFWIWILKRYQGWLESKIATEDFDRELSRKLDALSILLDD